MFYLFIKLKYFLFTFMFLSFLTSYSFAKMIFVEIIKQTEIDFKIPENLLLSIAFRLNQEEK